MDIIIYGTLCARGAEHEAAYRLLELAVRQEFGVQELPVIERKPGGKPFFPQYPHVHFNLSHSRAAVVCAVHDKPVGVDVEKVRQAPRRLANGMDDFSFFREWTAKEATIKRQGLGVGALLRSVKIDPRCCTFEEFLPGWIVTVCPSEEEKIQIRFIEAAQLT